MWSSHFDLAPFAELEGEETIPSSWLEIPSWGGVFVLFFLVEAGNRELQPLTNELVWSYIRFYVTT